MNLHLIRLMGMVYVNLMHATLRKYVAVGNLTCLA
jgi:hypothetical protein